MPKSGDLIYNQAPYQEVLLPEEMLKKYGNGIIFASGLVVDVEKVFGDLWKMADTLKGIGEKLYSDSSDVIKFLNDKGISLPENYSQLPYSKVIELKQNCENKVKEILLDLGYSNIIIKHLLSFDDLSVFEDEFKKHLDNTLYDIVDNLSAKRDIIRRVYKFSTKYFNSDIDLTLNALKHVQLYHEWCSIKYNYKSIDWSNVT